MTIVYMWISSHLLAGIFFFRRQERVFFEILIAITISCVYLWKLPTYDLIVYLDYFSKPYPYEIGFWKITEFFIQSISLKPEDILLFWQFLIFLALFFSSLRISQKNYLLSFLTVCLSLSFFLGSQNVLRQGIALSILTYGIVDACINRKPSITFFLCATTATLFHYTTPLFASILAIFFISNKCLAKKHPVLIPIAGASLGFIILFLLKINFPDSIYLDPNTDWGGERMGSWIKYILLAITFTISQYMAIGHITAIENVFFKLREFYFFFLFPIAFLPEMFSRLLFQYYFIEFLLISYMLSSPIKRLRLSSIFLFFSYGLAPNALNIILGERSL